MKLFFAVLIVCAFQNVTRAETAAGDVPKPPAITATPGTPTGVPPTAPSATAPATAPALPPAPVPPSLYMRSEGAYKIADIGDAFAERLVKNEALLTNEIIKKAFATLSKPALRFFVTSALCQVAGGPEQYTGQAGNELYQALKLTPDQWKAIVADLEQALESSKVSPELKKSFLETADQQYKKIADISGRIYKEKGIFIVFPQGWQSMPVTDAGILGLFAGPESKDGGARPIIRVLSEEFAPGIELNAREYMKLNQVVVSKQVKDPKTIQSQTGLALNGEPLERLVYALSDGKVETVVETYFLVRGRKGYAVQFSAPRPVYEQVQAQFVEALGKLRIE